MTGASLALCILLGQVPSADPFDLINQLGAPRYAEREAASSAIERLGRRALPALKAAREQRDPEIRTRAAILMTRIEGALLTQPTQVTLDFQDAPVSDVVRSFGEQAGIKLTLVPENSPNWKARRVTIHEAGPLPFWAAIDRLCDAAHLQYNLGMHAFPIGREPSFPLFEGGVRSSAPVSDFGPFRVSLVALHYQRDVSFPPALQNLRNAPEPATRPAPMVNEQCYAQLQIAGEPRLAVQGGTLRVTEAVDDRGNTLVVPTAGGDIRRSAYFGYSAASVIQAQAVMARPSQPGSSIKRLKGVVPVMISTRKANPLLVPLAGASGRTFQNDDVTLTINDVRLRPDTRPPSIEITIHPSAGIGQASAAGFEGNEPVAMRPDSHQQQLEVTDAQGRPIPWFQSNYDLEAGRMTLSLTSSEQAASATELHYYTLVRAATEVPFEFSDIPMP